MARGKNIISRRKINEALGTIHSPFTSNEMAKLTGLTAKKVQGLLRGHDGVVKESVSRNRNRYNRCRWRIVE